jgi:hypothetical protein
MGISRPTLLLLAAAGHVPMPVTTAEASDAGQKSFEHVTELIFPCSPGATALARDVAGVPARYGAASDSERAAQQRVAGALTFGVRKPRSVAT